MSVLGTIDRPGGFRHKAPYPRHIVPNYRTINSPAQVQPNTPLHAAPLGFPAHPGRARDQCRRHADPHRQGLLVGAPAVGARPDAQRHHQRDQGRPVPPRHAADLHGEHGVELDHEHHGGARDAQRARTTTGEYQIPFLVVCDAFQSEMVAFADLVLPDTTYLERHDAMSMLDRPISEFDGPCDSVRVPVVAPTGECRPFQDVLVELGDAPEAAGVHHRRAAAQVQGLRRLRRPLRARSPASASSWAGAARTAASI